jgi:hypothetical protein
MTVKKDHVFDLEVRAQSAPWYRGIEVLIGGVSADRQRRYIVVDPDYEEIDVINPVQVDASLSISLEAAQTLMDDLWACGVRPTEGKGSAGALKATEKHLEDMRKITFGFLKRADINERT